MGKEWLYWGGSGGGKSTKKGRSGGRGGGGGAEREVATPGCMCAVFQLFDLHQFQFTLHQQPSLKTDSFLQLQDEPSTVLKGVEAPRNSLELRETFMEAASLPSVIKEVENLNIPVGIQIKTSCENRSPRASTSSSKAKGEDLFSDCSSSSPGTKTPNLVARLMGLKLLPESGSPSLSSSRRLTSNSVVTNLTMHPQGESQKQEYTRYRQFLQSRPCSNRNSFFDNDIAGSVSLPETPRISSARRSDVEHRHSLQINKENIGEELEFSACAAKKMARRRDVKLQDENRSPGHYARNIVKQVRERVSRRVGLDITNTLKSREQRRDDQVVLLKPKKPSPVLTRIDESSSTSKQTTKSCSPGFRFSDPKNKAITSPITKSQASHSQRLSPLYPSAENQSQVQEANVLLKPKPQVPVLDQQQTHQQKSVQKCKKAGNERFNSRLKRLSQASDAIRNKQEEPFIRSTTTNKANISDKKCKKTPLSDELFPVRKDSSLLLTKSRHKQSQASDALSWERSTRLSSCSSRSYSQEEVTRTLIFQGNIQDKCMCNGTASTSVDEMEFQYIQRILKRTGIDKATPVSLAKWFSPSHPLDPSIFHYIELFHPSTSATTPSSRVSKLSHRSNRKLIFQLVNELLVDILKPYINSKPWIASPSAPRSQMNGSELLEELCRRIKDFPSANCQVLADIDALIDKDLRQCDLGATSESYEEVGERMASEIERDIMQSLVHETAMLVFGLAPNHVHTVQQSEKRI